LLPLFPRLTRQRRGSPHQVAAKKSGDESPHSETRTRQCYHQEEQLNHIALELRDGERRDSCGLWPLGLVEEVVPASKSTNYSPRNPQNTLTKQFLPANFLYLMEIRGDN